MIDPLDPLLTFMDCSSDMPEEQLNFEVTLLFERQRAIDRLLKGEIDTADLLELLADQHFNVDRYIDLATNNLEKAVAQEMPIDPAAALYYAR